MGNRGEGKPKLVVSVEDQPLLWRLLAASMNRDADLDITFNRLVFTYAAMVASMRHPNGWPCKDAEGGQWCFRTDPVGNLTIELTEVPPRHPGVRTMVGQRLHLDAADVPMAWDLAIEDARRREGGDPVALFPHAAIWLASVRERTRSSAGLEVDVEGVSIVVREKDREAGQGDPLEVEVEGVSIVVRELTDGTLVPIVAPSSLR